MERAFKLKSAETLPLTPDLAQRFTRMKASPTERELLPKRVKHLEQKILAGRGVTFHWAQAQLGEETLRMNGQHSSTMLASLNGNFPEGLFVHLDTYEVEDENALALLFRQFDDRVSNRSPSDVSAAYQMLEEGLRHIPRKTAKLLIEGVAWHNQYVQEASILAGDERYTLFGRDDLHAFLKWGAGIYSMKTPEMERVQIASAMYGTWLANPVAADGFWSLTARGGDTEEQAPATVLDQWLQEIKKNKRLQTTLKPGNFWNACIFAWNAFREDKPIKSVRYDTTKGLLTVNE